MCQLFCGISRNVSHRLRESPFTLSSSHFLSGSISADYFCSLALPFGGTLSALSPPTRSVPVHCLVGKWPRVLLQMLLVTCMLIFHICQLSTRKSRFVSINRTDKSRDAFVLVKLTNKFGFFSRGKFSSVRDKLKNNLLDAAYADWIQCKYNSVSTHFLNIDVGDSGCDGEKTVK